MTFGTPSRASLWKSSELPLERFRRSLPKADISVLLAAATQCANGTLDPTTLTADDLPVGSLGSFLDDLRDELVDRSGFVLLGGVPIAELPLQVIECFFWGLSLIHI